MQAPAPLRKPLALLFCDLAGTNRLTAKEGDLVASAVFREFYEHAGRLSGEHHSLTIKFVYDAFLSVFANIDDVMPFVTSIEHLFSENPMLVGRFAGFHFSLHYGEVVLIETSYGREVLGEAVTVVAELNEAARVLPQEIVVSQAALERMPSNYRKLAGPSEFYEFKRLGKSVEFHRISLAG
jgi:class 3 adenylate cyclase